MIFVFLAVALMSFVFVPSELAEPSPPEEIRIGDAVNEAKVAEIDEVKDTSSPDGWYHKSGWTWIFYPKGTVDDDKPPKAELTSFMHTELFESAAGLACLALPVVLIICSRRRKKRKAAAKEMKRLSGVSQAEFQALIRKLAGMEQILHNIMPDEIDGKRGRRKW